MTNHEKSIEAKERLEQCLANREAGVGAWSMVRPEDVRAVLDALAVFEKAHTPTDGDRSSEQQEEQRHGDRGTDHEEQQTDDRAATGRLGVGGSHASSMPQATSDGKRVISHTPTDDEREALDAEARAESERELSPLIVNGIDTMAAGRVAYAAGYVAGALRRSEVPEPSADDKIEWPDHWTITEKLRDLHARWHDQKGNLLGREACGWERCEFWDSAQFTLRLADVHIAGREPQGEPSDAQVEAASREIDSRGFHIPPMAVRAALRAASAVTEQGENRDA